jgi:hypothetical protein
MGIYIFYFQILLGLICLKIQNILAGKTGNLATKKPVTRTGFFGFAVGINPQQDEDR